MMIQIGTTGELGILIAGIMIGVACTVKTIKWIKEMVIARNNNGGNGNGFGRQEHDAICRGVKMEFTEDFKQLRNDIVESSKERRHEIKQVFAQIEKNHTEVRNLFQQQGERIAALEAKVGNNGR